MIELKNIPETSSIKVTSAGVALPKRPAKYVLLSNWNCENVADLTLKEPAASAFVIEELGFEVFWGFGSAYGHQLFPSQTTPFLIPVTDLSDIVLRCREGVEVIVCYSFWN